MVLNMHRTKGWLKTINEIVDLLALEKEVTFELLAEKTGKNYSTILRRINDLEKNGIVKLDRTEHTEAKGKEKKVYKITRRGLIYTLLNSKESRNHIDIIARSHADALLTFEKWDFFEKNGLHDYVLKRLVKGILEDGAASFRFDFIFPPYSVWERKTFAEMDEIHKDVVDGYVFGKYLIDIPYKTEQIESEKEKMLSFWKTIKTDRKISDWMKLELERNKIRRKGELEAVEDGIKFWDSL
jgi:DNA-binding PadR family transcriptional regulator